MSSLIACPGCSHKLMLPDHFAGQRVQCPQCLREFAAQAAPIPAMEVETVETVEAATPAVAAPTEPKPRVQTGYAPAPLGTARTPASDRPSIFCIRCGTKCTRAEDACPDCGHPLRESPDEWPREQRRPHARILPPIRGSLPILGAVLLPVGPALFIAISIVDEALRHAPPLTRFWAPLLLFAAGCATLLTALACFALWLYQAWRVVLHGDEEYSAGLMVGLLFVPFFNFYWIFRAVPGLSAGLQQELQYVAPRRVHSAGWIPGLVACIFALIPYGQPVAVCIFLAWMLIANNALHRLIRYHDELRAEAEREAAEQNGSTEV